MNPNIAGGSELMKRIMIIPTKEKHIQMLTVCTLNKKK